MAQHLLAAADRYGLDRLKAICEAKLAGCVDVGTAATTLALAEQHGCALLKAKCVDFVTGSPETLDAVLAPEGYAHLAASCPLVLAELLKSARAPLLLLLYICSQITISKKDLSCLLSPSM